MTSLPAVLLGLTLSASVQVAADHPRPHAVDQPPTWSAAIPPSAPGSESEALPQGPQSRQPAEDAVGARTDPQPGPAAVLESQPGLESPVAAGSPAAAPAGWDAFDAGRTDGKTARGYWRAAYDGRYVYYVPTGQVAAHGVVLRLDTRGDFDDAASWEAYDASGTGGLNCTGYAGAAFDGRYVYFAAWQDSTRRTHARMLRYDTRGGFKAGSSWLAYDASRTGGLDCRGYRDAVFDGRFVYYVPFRTSGAGADHHGRVLRYDTQGAFNAAGSWTVKDAGAIGGYVTRGYKGGVFDGRWLYLVANNTNGLAQVNYALRYDTTAPFEDSSSWEVFDASAIGGLVTIGYSGGVFDGRYVYYVPISLDPEGYHGRVLRYDTDAGFTSPDSWSVFDAGTLGGANSRGYLDAVFDGRHVTFVPYYEGTEADGGFHGVVMRYDTTRPFAALASWDTYDASATDGLACRGYAGGAFDGRFVYMAPLTDSDGLHGRVLRYDTFAPWPPRPPCTLSCSALGPTSASTGEDAAFSATFAAEECSGSTALEWSFGDGATSSEASPRHVYADPGVYAWTLTVTAGDAACARSGSITVAEPSAPDPPGWDAHDAAGTDGQGARGYWRAAYDGRYVYYVPTGQVAAHGVVLRLDTRGDFDDAASWEAYDASGTGGFNCTGYAGATFDGRYVYFAAWENSTRTTHGRMLRYDTRGGFKAGSSWLAYDASRTGGLDCRGYRDAVFDGRFVYYVPFRTSSAGSDYHARVLRYDTRGAFDAAGSWAVKDAGAIGGYVTKGYKGGVFDGRWLYLVANNTNGLAQVHYALRYDTTKLFQSSASWEVFDASAIGGLVTIGYSGAVFDGRFVYYVPISLYPEGYHGRVLRYDTDAGFTSPDSWSVFDAETLGGANHRGYLDAVFDGRHVTFVPYYEGTEAEGSFHGVVMRYDTTRPFAALASWDTYDASATDGLACRGYAGGAFDGRFVYMAPQLDSGGLHGRVLRYDTLAPWPYEPCTLACSASGAATATASDDALFSATFAADDCAGVAALEWDFGDGTTSAVADSRHVYADPGLYTWTLTVTVGSASCTRSGTTVVTACDLVCSAEVTPLQGAAPLTVRYAAKAGAQGCSAAPNLTWSTGDGGVSAQAAFAYTYEAPGEFTWALTVTLDNRVCTQSGPVTVANKARSLRRRLQSQPVAVP